MSIQLRINADGRVCCSSSNAAGQRGMPEHMCDACKAHFAALRISQETDMTEDYAPPDSYGPALAVLRAATATNESTFEARWKAERLRELDAEGARLDARIEATPFPRLTASEAEEFAPPDPYKAGLDKMRREGR